MPLNKVNTAQAIRGRIKLLTNKQRKDCQDVIAQLVYADLGRSAGTLHRSGDARLDMQGFTSEGAANLQVQIGKGTAAAVLIASTTWTTTDPKNQIGVQNGVISVLNQSLDTETVWELQGQLP